MSLVPTGHAKLGIHLVLDLHKTIRAAMPRVNPEILRWARETAGLSLIDATRKLQLREARGVAAVDRLAAYESGETEPTRPLLVKMARHYRRPLLTFYLAAPPKKGDRGQDFRTLPADAAAMDEALLDALIRDVRARQGLVRAVLADDDEAAPLDFIGSMRRTDGVDAVLASIRETLDLSLEDFRAAKGPDSAFQLLRSKVESGGVFVLLIGNLGSHHTAISAESFRGFALADDLAPFVVINDQDSRAAWSFTLLHELTHLWLGQTGVSGGPGERGVERFCNDVAGEFLLPASELSALEITPSMPEAAVESVITTFAKARNISRSMVAYKLFREDVISHALWRRLSDLFRKQWQMERRRQQERNKDQAGGPNYYTVRRHRLGNALIQLVSRTTAAGDLTTAKAAQVLGVKIHQVHTLASHG